jgi:hypothetical protein
MAEQRFQSDSANDAETRARPLGQQATVIAYIDDYKLLMFATLAVMPLLIVFGRPSADGGHGQTMVVE